MSAAKARQTQPQRGATPGAVRELAPAVGRSARRGLSASVGTSPLLGAVLVIAGLALSWVLSMLAGGAGRVVPHWYYVPILFAAARFGHGGAFVVALVAGVLAGPLTPQFTATGVAQLPSEWVTRGAFFTLVGQLAALFVGPSLPSLSADLQRVRLERALRRALARDELDVHYQPIFAVGSNEIVGAEALLRWQHPERGELTAGEFMPLAETCPVIDALGDFVLRRACAQASQWQQLIRRPLCVSVNLSAAELDDAALPERIEQALERSGLAPGCLCLEVTESTLICDLDGSVARLERLKAMGVTVAIDDFGTGYSSLSYVHRLPADALKIDRSFMHELATDRQGAAVVGGVVLLARSLGMTTVAEGIETLQQARCLAELDCEQAQGFHYARPGPASAMTARLTAEAQPTPPPPGDRRSRVGRDD